MNKKELVAQVAGKIGITKRDIANVIGAFTETITESLSKGEKVTLAGFGTFQVMQRKARRGVNPRTGDEIQIPAKKAPKFAPGKNFRKKVE